MRNKTAIVVDFVFFLFWKNNMLFKGFFMNVWAAGWYFHVFLKITSSYLNSVLININPFVATLYLFLVVILLNECDAVILDQIFMFLTVSE